MGFEKDRWWTPSLFAFTFLFYYTSCNPLQHPNLCGSLSCTPKTKFNYSVGVSYTHRYSVDAISLFRGTSDNKSTLYTEALVHLTFLTPCQGVLKVTNVRLSSERSGYDRENDEDIVSPQLPNAEKFAEALSKKDLRFEFQDGSINEICPDPEDPTWVVNFKRGILSAFHNTMMRFDVDSSPIETDVNGECVTTYRLQGARTTALAIERVKDMDSCKQRFKYNSIIQTDQYNFGSGTPSLPLIKSRHKCNFSIDRKIYNVIECEELHTFRPFSRGENGSQSITRQRISLLTETAVNVTETGEPPKRKIFKISLEEPILKRTSLLFDHDATPKPISGELKTSRDLIKQLCRLDIDDVQLPYPDTFAKLIHIARRLSYVALSQIYYRAGSICSSGRKHMSDALPLLGSAPAVQVMVEYIMKGSVDQDTAREWLVAMAFIKNPDISVLETASGLLNSSEPQAILTISTMTHSYCKQNSDCHEATAVKKIYKHLALSLDSCSKGVFSNEDKHRLMLNLKAIGNLGGDYFNISEALKTCVMAQHLDISIRVAAIHANRRGPCFDVRPFFLDFYRNNSVDTELRIAAYLQVMRCPNYYVISLIKQTLEIEEMNQVGSFVWSHLQNQLSSLMPAKVEVQTLLTDKKLGEKFNKDKRKFSRNYESSMFFDEYNVGGNIESNVIFSPKSYIPRSTSMNITVDLFGESINAVEVEARTEGFEHYIEKFFGPSGPLSATNVNSHVNKVLRVLRSAALDPIILETNEIPNVIDNNFFTPKLAIGYKIFGNEIFYTTYNGPEELADLVNKLNPIRKIQQLLSGKEFVLDKAWMFLEADYVIPTGVGLPVTLSATGTSAVHFNVAGKVGALELLNLDIEGKFKPSVAIDVTGIMGIDAYYAVTGVKLKSSFYTSTAVEGHVVINGKTKATVSFNLPKEKGEIITLQSKLIVVKGDVEEEQAGIIDKRVSANLCSWPSLDHTLGLKICMNVGFPNATEYSPGAGLLHTVLTPLKIQNHTVNSTMPNLNLSLPSFFLSGPAHLAIAVHKADPTAARYVLQYRWDQNDNKTNVTLSYDTPGSELRRELSAKLFLDSNSKNLTLLFQGVDNKFEAHGNYRYTAVEKYLDFSLNINGKQQLAVQMGLRTREIKHGFIYYPRLLLTINAERIAELKGTVKIQEKKEVTQWDVNLEFATKKLSTQLNGYVNKGLASWGTRMALNYKFKDEKSEKLRLDLRLENKSSKSLMQVRGDFTVESTAYRSLNFDSSLQCQRAQGHIECKLIVNTQPQLKDERHNFTVHVGFSIQKSFERYVISTFVDITKPISAIDLGLGLKYESLEDKSTTHLTLRYATAFKTTPYNIFNKNVKKINRILFIITIGKEMMATLILHIPRRELFYLDAKVNITLPTFIPMIFTLRIDQKKDPEVKIHSIYDITSTGVWFSGHNFTAGGIYVDKSEGVLQSHLLKLYLTSPSFSDISLNGRFFSDEHQFKLELSAEHKNDKYGLALKHAMFSSTDVEIYGEIRYKSSMYSATTVVNLLKQRQVLIELHLDQHRDVHIAWSGVNQQRVKEAGLEIKWDANRDPSQKLVATVGFLYPKPLNYSASMSISYPGRKVLGSAIFAILGTVFESGFHLDWNPNEAVDLRLGAKYRSDNLTMIRVHSQLLTPFSGWKRTSFAGGWLSEGNKCQANGSVWWQDDQTVGFDVFWDYALPGGGESDVESADSGEIKHFPDLWCAFNASLISTVADVTPMRMAFAHRQEMDNFETLFHWQGKEKNQMLFKSLWHFLQSHNATNVTGTVLINTPYKGYQKGRLIGRLYYTADLDIDGVAELEMDRKEYVGTIKGHVKSLRDNMLAINLTTPIPNYSEITGRIGYSESNRHLVCLWTTPLNAIGFEILLVFDDTSNFDLLALVATPLDFFSKFLLLGKRKPHMVDLRMGLNDMLLGVVGSWKYLSSYDFDYRYTLFTPLTGFHETGVVAKVVANEGLDLDLRMRIAEIKAGLTLLAGKKPLSLGKTILKNVPLQDEEEEDFDPESATRWRGSIQLDCYFYPTITGELDIDEIGSTTVVEGNLRLAKGTIYLYDELYFMDMFNMKNDLLLRSPFVIFKEITVVSVWTLVMKQEMHMSHDIQVVSYNTTKKGGIMLNIKANTGEIEEEEEEMATEDSEPSNDVFYKGHFKFFTPFEAFPLLDISSHLELIENTYKGNFTILTNSTKFTVDATLLEDKEFQRVAFTWSMTSPKYVIPPVTLIAKREVTVHDYNVELSVSVPALSQKYNFESFFSNDFPRTLKLRCVLETTHPHYPKTLLNFVYNNITKENLISIDFRIFHAPMIDLKMSAQRKSEDVTLSLETPLTDLRKIHFSGSLVESVEPGTFDIKGIITVDGVNHPITSSVSVKPDLELKGKIGENLDIRIFFAKRENLQLILDLKYLDKKFSGEFEFTDNQTQFSEMKTKIDSNLNQLPGLYLVAGVKRAENGSWVGDFYGKTPWTGIKSPKLSWTYAIGKSLGKTSGLVSTDFLTASTHCSYAWMPFENVLLSSSIDYRLFNDTPKHAHVELFHKQPNQNFQMVSSGFDLQLDHFYTFGINSTLLLPSQEDVSINAHLKLPNPLEVHSLMGKLRYTKTYSYVAHTLQYNGQFSKAFAATSGEVSMNKSEVLGNIQLQWGYKPNIQSYNSMLLYKRPNSTYVDVQYVLHTPYYAEDTFFAKILATRPTSAWNITAHLSSPRSNKLSTAVVSYNALNNMNGTVHSKTPFAKLPYAGIDFVFLTQPTNHLRRFVKVVWPNNTAFVETEHTDVYSRDSRQRDVVGKLKVEIPLATRHVADVSYKYLDTYPTAHGECVVHYNSQKLLSGKYDCISESRGGYEKDNIDIVAENLYFPVGIKYIHEFEYSAEYEGTNLPTVDRKSADIFKLNNRTAFSLSGNLEVKSLLNGKEIKVTALHGNRTVKLETDYEFLDHEFTHSSSIQLDPAVWVSYDLHILNKTTVVMDEEHVELNISYPRRNFTATGHIRSDKRSHESELKLEWDRPFSLKTVGAGFEWWRASRKPDQQVATLRFKHPSFAKDVTLNTTYIRHGTKSLETRLDIEYSLEAHKKVELRGRLEDVSSVMNTSGLFYRVNVSATHPATKLDLGAIAEINVTQGVYLAAADAKYRRSFLSLQHGLLQAKADVSLKEVDFKKKLQHEESYLRARFYNDEPCCSRLNGSLAKTDVLNYTGDFFIDFDEKLLLFVVNMTPDASENFRAYGFIPDARNAELTVRRAYEQLTVTDIAYYLKLNHSRLVTSRLKWRPTLQREVMEGLEYIYLSLLKHLDETADYWKEYIRSEVKESVSDIWLDSKPDIKQFLNDLEDLKLLENDMEELKTFLNDSYNHNDFYVKDVTGAILLLFDELALKGHIQSVPAILGEIWQALGESGEAIRKSFLWIIETIKSTYRKAIEFIHQLLHGDATSKISSILEDWFHKYDRMIKELQMTVFKHIEQLYANLTEMISESWNNMLRSIEPTYIKLLHYLETVVWDASHEILDFLYERKVELTESPFFSQLANFTHDLDVLYKDWSNRDLLTNINEYSVKMWNFIKERYLNKIPFGKEIKQVIAEIVEGFQELEKLPSINFFIKKRDEVLEKIHWFWGSLELGPKMKLLVTLIHRRIMDISYNALQAEDRYREAKTKFIFEPELGIVLLEQKLPMSWHAFNETPRFEEIPEYRTLANLQSQLALSNKTFWAFYYEYKPYTEINNWLPPFKAQALIIGSQHVRTFDGRIIAFKGSCDYLLARDFIGGNFSLVIHRDDSLKPDHFIISLLRGENVVSLDIFNDIVKLPKQYNNQLPAEIDGLFIYKDKGIVIIQEKDGFTFECNVLFQVCSIKLSGWYFGKTAGLLGTMDHEPFTDYLTSYNTIEPDLVKFAKSWMINKDTCDEDLANKVQQSIVSNKEVHSSCHALFVSKTSQFSPCFGRVDPYKFYNICVANKRELCSAAAAYIQACQAEYALLTVPEICVQCSSINDTKFAEGDMIHLTANDIQPSADVVFIVEAKECNRNMQEKRNIDLFLTILSKELDDVRLKGNRYAVVVFGGSGVFSEPRSLMTDQEVFTSRHHLLKNFHQLRVGNGSEDIFEAIAFASAIDFRPGVAKIFIAIPCSNCDPLNMTMEYSVLRQVLLEKNIKLHILMNNNFAFEKQRVAKIFYGLDSTKAYTKKDFRELTGDIDLRRQAKLPKSILGYCAPLALETNGTVFAARWLTGDKINPVKKFASVFGKRVAQFAEPSPCQHCECSSHDSGMGFMDCRPCDFPSPAAIDLGINDYIDGDFFSVQDGEVYDDHDEEDDDESKKILN